MCFPNAVGAGNTRLIARVRPNGFVGESEMGGNSRILREGVHGNAVWNGDDPSNMLAPSLETCNRFRGGLDGGGLGRTDLRFRLFGVADMDVM